MEIPLLKDSRSGERAIDWGKLFQTDIVLGKKENLYEISHECCCICTWQTVCDKVCQCLEDGSYSSFWLFTSTYMYCGCVIDMLCLSNPSFSFQARDFSFHGIFVHVFIPKVCMLSEFLFSSILDKFMGWWSLSPSFAKFCLSTFRCLPYSSYSFKLEAFYFTVYYTYIKGILYHIRIFIS